MAGSAGSARIFAMYSVASEATQSLVNADGRAIIPGVDLPLRPRSMTLVAERLALVGRNIHSPRSIEHLGKRKFFYRYVFKGTSIK